MTDHAKGRVVPISLILIFSIFSFPVIGLYGAAQPDGTGSRTGDTWNQPDIGFSEDDDHVEFVHMDGTHNTSFKLDETILINITTTVNDNPGELKLRVYDHLGNRFHDIGNFFIQQPGGPPYRYAGSIDATVANGFSNDHFLFEVRLKDNTNIITFDTIEIGGGADPPKYIRTFSDPDCTDPSYMFTKNQFIYVEVYTGGSVPTTGNSKISLHDYRENVHEQTDDSYTLAGDYSRFSYNLSATTINLVEGDWYTVNAQDLRNSGGTHLIENWHAQIQIVPEDIINITMADVVNGTGQPQYDLYSGDEVVVKATANHNNHALRILEMNMTVTGPEGVLIDNRSMDMTEIDPVIPPLWKNFTTSFNLSSPPRGDYVVDLTVLGKGNINNYTELQFTVHNHLPTTDDLHIGKNMTLRNSSVPIFFNGSDIEDGEANLTPHLEYNDSVGSGWNRTYLTQPFYDNDVWIAAFEGPLDAPLGCYGFRLRFNDSDGDHSQWLEQNDPLCIVNEGPTITDIQVSADEVVRTRTVSLFVNASDIETPRQDLTIDLQYGPLASNWTNLTAYFNPSNGLWVADLTLDTTAVLGNYSVRARVADEDGNISNWFEAIDLFKVLNNLPVISDDLDMISIDAWFIEVQLDPYGSDVEDDDQDLIWDVDRSTVDPELITADIFTPDNILRIEPVGTVEGQNEITLNLTDRDNGTVKKTDIQIIVDMDIPEEAPKVSLASPADEGKVNTLQPELRWSVDHSGSGTVLYDIYLDTEETPRTVIAKNFSTTIYPLKNDLIDGQTYYWTVQPHIGNKPGICLSGTWTFIVDLNITISYGVNITIDTSRIILPQGSTGKVNVTVKNMGNTADVVRLEVDRGGFSGTVIPSDPNPWLDMNDPKKIALDITIPNSHVPGDSIVIVKGISQGGGGGVSDSAYLTVTVIEKGTTARYGVNITLDRETVSLEQGKSTLIRLTVCNAGNVRENITLTYSASEAGELDIQLGVGSLTLDGGDCKDVTVTLVSPNDMKKGKYPVTFQAVTDGADDTQGLVIKVEQKAADNIFDPFSNLLFCLLPFLIGVLLLVVIIIMIMTRKKGAGLVYAEADMQGQTAMAYPMVAEEVDEGVEDFDIKEVFIIYQGGRLIKYQSMDEEDKADMDLLSGMLVAIKSFVEDSFKSTEGKIKLDGFTMGEKKVIIALGNHLILAVVLDGVEPPILKDEMLTTVQKIEGLYAGIIEAWDGNINRFENIGLYIQPLIGLKEKMKIKAKKKKVRMKSGMEFVRGYVRLKVAVQNDLDDTIKELTMTLDHDVNSLRLDQIEPDYPHSGSNIFLTDIHPKEKRTVAAYFDPVICQESHIDGWVTYKGPDGEIHEARMKRKPVDIVCPIFYTTETVNVAMLKRLLDELDYTDSRLYPLRDLSMLKELYKQGKEVIRGYDVKFVREYSEDEPYAAETWFYGEVSETNEKVVIRVSASETDQNVEIFVATNNLASMTGLLAELGSEFKLKIKKNDMFKEHMLSKMDHINLNIQSSRPLLDKQSESEVESEDEEI